MGSKTRATAAKNDAAVSVYDDLVLSDFTFTSDAARQTLKIKTAINIVIAKLVAEYCFNTKPVVASVIQSN